MPFQFCKILNNLIFNPEKLKMCNSFPKFYQNLTSGSGSKQRLNFVTVKISHSGSVPEDSGS